MSHLSQSFAKIGEMSAGLWKLSLVVSLLVYLPLVRTQASAGGGDGVSAHDDHTAQVSRRYLERLLHVYGEGGSIDLKGLEHMLRDISIKNDHGHFEHHDHSLFEEHSTDEHIHLDHGHSSHADHSDHDHSSHADHSEHDHSSHADHSEDDHSSHTDHSEHDHSSHADHSEHDHSSHVDHSEHDHSSHADHSDHEEDQSGHTKHSSHDDSQHIDHSHHGDHRDHLDHDGNRPTNHSAHSHGDHADHSNHDHSELTDHPGHSAHADHDHSAHADHDHSAHAEHDHSAHADHDHSAHADHDHSGHADHDHSQRAPADHERGLAPRDGAGVSEVFSTREDAARHPRALPPADPETATVPYSVGPVEACPSLSGLLLEFGLAPEAQLSVSNLSLLCPALVYRVSVAGCREYQLTDLRDHDHSHGAAHQPTLLNSSRTQKWLFAGLAVLCISLCGLAGVAVVPIMQRVVYRQLLQFLVALAVGTLAGDALLHLLPHALTPHAAHSGDHGDHGDHSDHSDHGAAELDAVLKGLVALAALLFFFVAERAIGILHGTCTRGRTKKIKKRLAGMRHLNRETTEMIGQRINSYRHSAGASHCFADPDTRDVLARLNDSHGSCDEDRETEAAERQALTVPEETPPPLATSERGSPPPSTNPAGNDHLSPKLADSGIGGSAGSAPARESCERFSASERVARSSDFTVIIHEHEHRHHGHTHTHGHIHQPPGSAAAVAGMVIVGDGLHNFTDGMAIGAAFAAGLASGLSTSVAVFCHELPHEIGDFAVLLQSGMSVRQALFYNVVSSVLCLFGMVLGMLLGNLEAFSAWVFAAAAGSFLYIALVDMIPELTTSGGAADGSSPCGQLTVQLLGMCCGAGIMLAIAIYEHDLHSLVTVL